MARMPTPLSPRDRARGCLLLGACGDALGAAIEFESLAQIRHRHGAAPVREMLPAYGRAGAITDDTQMTLFTAEGLIRARTRFVTKGICHPPGVVHHAYLRWLRTQGEGSPVTATPDGWLVTVPALHARRAPGNTCLSALRGAVRIGEPARNDSKGCGGVMRTAPAGLIARDAETAFRIGCEVAALTHGHPSGFLPAGHLAGTIRLLGEGLDLHAALDGADRLLARREGHEETAAALAAARALAALGPPSPEALETLGGGWTGEEALAIAVCCALAFPDPEEAVAAAVNHSGDSDSTGAICGNLVGAWRGEAAIPPRWLAVLELRDVIARLAEDLADDLDPEASWDRYPGA